jgi:uncharacterized membrane-anchored protein YhcB (DUF1043 family)
MPNEATEQRSAVVWQNKQVYAMAAICLVIGLAIGYLFRPQLPGRASRAQGE